METATRGLSSARRLRRVSKAAARSPRQMLWPSMTPATRVFVGQARGRRAGTRAAHEVEADGLDGRCRPARAARRRGCRTARRRRSPGAARASPSTRVGALERRPAARRAGLDALADEGGLVELHPLGAGRGETAEQVGVDGQQVVEAVERREARRRLVARLAEEQEGDRADDDGAGEESGGLGLRRTPARCGRWRGGSSVSGPISGTR